MKKNLLPFLFDHIFCGHIIVSIGTLSVCLRCHQSSVDTMVNVQ